MKKLIIQTKRLCIRPLKRTDLDNFYAYRSNREVTKYQGFDVFTKQEAKDFIEKQQDKVFGKAGEWVQYAIELLETRQLIGDCAIKLYEHDTSMAEIGITLHLDAQKKGFAKEAMQGLLAFLFDEKNIRRVVERMDAENTAVIHLMQSLGFNQEGHFKENIFFKGRWGSEIQFAMLKKDWDTLKNTSQKPWLQSVQLEGEKVRLVPLEAAHRNGLIEAASDGKLWELWFTSVPTEQTMDAYIHAALEAQQAGKALPFTIIDKATNKIIGCTRYANVVEEHKRLEIGYTWYAKSYQRTGANSECKLLLLKHAFEELNCIAVEFMTNWHNHRSRAAISRLGAKQDGVLRNHRLNADGTFRDSVVFSIIAQEWPSVKKSLVHDLRRER